MKILFLHAWQSVPGGVKPTYLVQHAHIVIHPGLPGDDFDAALAIGQTEFDKNLPDVIVGIRRGGALAIEEQSATGIDTDRSRQRSLVG